MGQQWFINEGARTFSRGIKGLEAWKYLIQDSELAVLSNKKMNAYLKDIVNKAGIHKNLTFHKARHTFAATVILSNGVFIETVSRCPS